MRIVGGRFKGRILQPPKGNNTRPTTDRVRESLFNILAHRKDFTFTGKRVLDVYAGSGALGLEALSRGAAFCVFIESAASARTTIRHNVDALGLWDHAKLHRRSALFPGTLPKSLTTIPPVDQRASKSGFDLAFLDPPYGQDMIKPTLRGLAEHGWIAPDTILVTEQRRTESTDIYPWACTCVTAREFGDTRVQIASLQQEY